jgi:hypothetical protein
MVYARVIEGTQSDDPLSTGCSAGLKNEGVSEHDHALPFVGNQLWWLACCVLRVR